MQYFFSDNWSDNLCHFSESELKHLRVLRIGAGKEIMVLDGAGTRCRCVIEKEGQSLYGKILDQEIIKAPQPALHLMIAPPKNGARLENVLERATEFGVAELTPLICRRSERFKVRSDRLQKAALSSCKQSGNPYLPVIHGQSTFEEALHTARQYPVRLMAYLNGNQKVPLLRGAMLGAGRVVCMIGPEGGFTHEEAGKAAEAGVQLVSLGPRRLRTETAGILVASLAYLFSLQQ